MVGVFVNESAEEMYSLYRSCNLDVLQLHSKKAIGESRLLPYEIPRIYLAQDQMPRHFNKAKDFLLYDHPSPGCGYQLNWENLNPREEVKFF